MSSLIVPWWAWAAVLAVILAMLAIDLFAHRRAHVVGVREALAWSAVWVTLGLSFGAVVWTAWGPEAGGEYLAGYLIEKSLAVDNIFVFVLLFSFFAIPRELQHRVLFYGVLGALVLRALFIGAGAVALDRFHWVLYLFGAFLVFTGIKMARHNAIEVHPEHNPALRVLRRLMPVTNQLQGQRFLVRDGRGWAATPLLAALIAVETTDIVFAVDSIPAIFAVTDETFLVFTSNAFAILGLRAMYFLLADAMHRFGYLRYGLAAVLVFVGTKMVLSDVYKVPIWVSLAAIATFLTVSVLASRRIRPRPEESRGAIAEGGQQIQPGEGTGQVRDPADAGGKSSTDRDDGARSSYRVQVSFVNQAKPDDHTR